MVEANVRIIEELKYFLEAVSTDPSLRKLVTETEKEEKTLQGKSMENQNVQPTAPQTEVPVSLKLPYAPPMSNFVPLKPEEGLWRMGVGIWGVLTSCC